MNHSILDKQGTTEEEFLDQYNPDDFERLSLCVDTVIFSINTEEQTNNYRKLDQQKLTVLLVKRKEHPCLGRWSLPGGFVGVNETIDKAALRVLKNKTGIDDLYLEQLYTFGDPIRDPRMRIVSCAYLSLIDRSKYHLVNSDLVSESAWFEIELLENKKRLSLSTMCESFEIPIEMKEMKNGKIKSMEYTVPKQTVLSFDHATIILEGLLRLRRKIEYTDVVFNLLPEQFTITQLQQIYEIILGQSLLAPAFRRKIAKKIKETGEYRQEKGHRPSQYFTYRRE